MPARGYRKPPAAARAAAFKLRLTPAERAHLAACVEASDARSQADFIRRLILGEPIRRRASPERAEVIRQLQKIGVNLNQLARIANAGRQVSERDLQAALDDLRRALRQVTIGR